MVWDPLWMWLPPGTSLIAEDRRGPAGLCWRALPHLTDVPEKSFLRIGIEAGDIVPLCSGWGFTADKTSNRVVLRNIITGAIFIAVAASTAQTPAHTRLDNAPWS